MQQHIRKKGMKKKISNEIAAHSQLYVLTEYTTYNSVQDGNKKKFSFLLKRETRVSILGFNSIINSDEEVAIEIAPHQCIILISIHKLKFYVMCV